MDYIGKYHAEHLRSVSKEHYDIEEDWGGKLYYGIDLSWNYDEGYGDISMPNYVYKQLIKYRHTASKRSQCCPYEPVAIQYGRKSQKVPVKIESKALDTEGKLRVQQVLSIFMYYTQAVDMNILNALNSIAKDSSKPIERTMEHVEQLLDYMHTSPSTVVRYHTSHMILNVHSDTKHPSADCERSRAGQYFPRKFTKRRNSYQVHWKYCHHMFNS